MLPTGPIRQNVIFSPLQLYKLFGHMFKVGLMVWPYGSALWLRNSAFWFLFIRPSGFGLPTLPLKSCLLYVTQNLFKHPPPLLQNYYYFLPSTKSFIFIVMYYITTTWFIVRLLPCSENVFGELFD